MTLYEEKRHEYLEKGYCVFKNVMSTEFLEEVFDELVHAKDVLRYDDRLGNLRRLEKVYDKGDKLIEINRIFLNLLKSTFDEDFTIFKDKYNAKPPGGEGFFAHYDGVFRWPDKNGVVQDGWYIYADEFINVLVAIDDCTPENGPLEVTNIRRGDFKTLLQDTRNEGTPDLKEELEKTLDFEKVLMDAGDVLFFSNLCPHRSGKNMSDFDRRTLYYTYNKASAGDNYQRYFDDKEKTKNTASQALAGEI